MESPIWGTSIFTSCCAAGLTLNPLQPKKSDLTKPRSETLCVSLQALGSFKQQFPGANFLVQFAATFDCHTGLKLCAKSPTPLKPIIIHSAEYLPWPLCVIDNGVAWKTKSIVMIKIASSRTFPSLGKDAGKNAEA